MWMVWILFDVSEITEFILVVASAFYKDYPTAPPQVAGIQFACDLLKLQVHNPPDQLSEYQKSELHKQFNGLEFKTIHLQHRFRCSGIQRLKTAATYKWVTNM